MTTMSPEAVARLKKDVREAAATLSDKETRFLVDAYYAIQGHRIEAQSQVRSLVASEEPNAVISWLFDQHKLLEGEIQKVLSDYTNRSEAGLWARSILGIGPVISAGLLAHIDITKAPTVGHIWRFAGLDPSVQWGKGEKRPWNAALKVVCWKAGESFVKVNGRPCLPGTERVTAARPESAEGEERAEVNESTREGERAVNAESTDPLELPDCLPGCANYGHVQLHRKALELQRNEAGMFADQAAATLAAKRIGKNTEAYKAYSQGKLPRARIQARASRYAVKLFLSHFHHVLYVTTFGEDPPKPYILTQQDHVHFVGPPNWPIA